MLETIDPNSIADEGARQIVIYLMNVVEQLSNTVQEQAEENQRLRDEISRLKGEQGKPKIKANKPASNLSQVKRTPRVQTSPQRKQAGFSAGRSGGGVAGRSKTPASRCEV